MITFILDQLEKQQSKDVLEYIENNFTESEKLAIASDTISDGKIYAIGDKGSYTRKLRVDSEGLYVRAEKGRAYVEPNFFQGKEKLVVGFWDIKSWVY